nr:RNA polymerase sigma-70 region 1.2 [Tanacetum cinerariifolium]
MLKDIVNRDVGDAYMEVSEDEEEFEIHTMIKMKMLILNSLYQIILLTAHTSTNVLSEASKIRTDEALGAEHGSTSHLAQNEWWLGTSLPSKLVTTEYADAAAEAIALARAAVEVAKNATAMMMNHQTHKPLITKSVPTVPESDNSINDLWSLPSEEDEPTVKELQLLEEQLSAIIAVRSKRKQKRQKLVLCQLNLQDGRLSPVL